MSVGPAADGEGRDAAPPGLALRVVDAEPRQRVFLTGLITDVRTSNAYGPCLEADLQDGTGRVTLVFFGRDAIEGVTPGACLAASARLLEHARRLELLNPSYEFVPAPRDL